MIRILLMGMVFCALTAPAQRSLTISAGDVDREHVLVEFDLPKGTQNSVDIEGKLYPVQVSGGRGWLLLKSLPKGQQLKGRLGKATDINETVKVERAGKKLKVSAAGKPVLEYQAEPGEFPRQDIQPLFRRGGYIHPIYTLSGKVITDDFPPNHIHHHGVWFTWSNAEFEGRPTDFWNMGDGKGLVEFVSVGDTWSGAVQGGFTAKHRYVDLTSGSPKTALNEDW